MDVTIQNQRLPALEVNGRYYQTFTPLSAGELIKLHHMGCMGDTVVTDIQLEQGDFPTGFVEPTITQRSLSGLFEDMRNIELELRDSASTFWGKIQQTNEGALTQFFKDKVKSAIAQTASEIRTEVADAANKARVQVTADGVIIGSTKITGEQLASTISVSPRAIELITPKIKVKSDMIVDGAITAGKLSAGAIRSENIQANAITSKQLMVDLAMAEKLASSEILAKKLFAKEAFVTRVQSVTIDASMIKTGTLKGRLIEGGIVHGSQIIAGEIKSSTIESGTLTGHTQIKLGEYGSFDIVSGGIQINVPREPDTKDGLGVQFIGSYGRGENVPYGLFIYKDPDFTTGGYVSRSDDFLLTVEGYIKANGIGWFKIAKGNVGGKDTAAIGFWNSDVSLDFGGSGNDIYYSYAGKSYGLWSIVNQHFSDRRLKENIVDCKHKALDYIRQFQFKEYDWKKQKDRPQKAHTKIGLIAQEVQEVDPTLVYENGDTLNLDNLRLTNIALKAIQELNQKINRLEKMNERKTA